MIENKKIGETQEESNYWSTERVNELLRKADEEGLDFKSVDNPYHDNNPELKRANVLFEYTKEETLEIKKCAEDVTYFSKYCQVMTDTGLNYIKLREYQTSVLKEYQNNRMNIFLAPRQVGKCLLPTSTVRDKNDKKVSINSLIFKKNIYFYIKNILYRIYLKL
jgi:hypothetical protein